MPSSTTASDRSGVRALATAFAAAGACVSLTWVVPALAPYRPWEPGDPIPVLAALTPKAGKVVEEDAINGLTVTAPADVASDPVLPPTADAPVDADPDAPVAASAAAVATGTPATPAGPLPSAAGMPSRPPGVATALVDADYRGMDTFYRALHRAASGAGLARAAHYGDSTIAADGITSQVRSRLQARFGNGGPGYLSAGMDPRWNMRRDVTISRSGTWDTVSLLLGGGGGRYGYGGIVSTAAADATLSITAPKGKDGKPTPMHRFEVWLQGGPDRGAWWATLDGAPAGGGSARTDAVVDRRHAVDDADGYTRVTVGASGGSVPFYGLVMETAGPGVVWDALGVVGVGSRSFTQHSRKHLASQVAQRAPDLLVIMLGGNELGLPALGKGDGAGYVPYFTDTVQRLRAGAPGASCLIVTPIDQGTREGGTATTKPNLPKLVEAQRKAAAAEGCAFWNAWAAMGGTDAIARWSTMKPPLAWADLNHLSKNGQDIIGNLFADAIEHGYDGWVAAGGPARPAVTTPAAQPPADPMDGAAPPAEPAEAAAVPAPDAPAPPADAPPADLAPAAPAPAPGGTP